MRSSPSPNRNCWHRPGRCSHRFEGEDMTDSHTSVFVRAVETVVGAGHDDPDTLFTEDVNSWSPALNAQSLAELSEALDDRDRALSNVAVSVRSLHSSGSRVMAEW